MTRTAKASSGTALPLVSSWFLAGFSHRATTGRPVPLVSSSFLFVFAGQLSSGRRLPIVSSWPLCSAYYQCAAGLYCYNNGGQPGSCTETIELGQPCPIDSFYAFYSCGFGAYCKQSDAGPACVAYGSIGDPCLEPHGQVDIPFNACRVGLACIDSLCAPEPQSGPCPTVGHCASQSFCDARLNCEPLREDGESCAQEANGCKSGLCGDAGTCVTAGSYCPN